MNRPWRPTVVAVPTGALLASSALVGCSVVDQPDPATWDSRVGRTLSDLASEVATARLALDTAARERAWSSYTVVLVAEAEEAAATLEDDLERLQVPPEREADAEVQLAVVADGVDAVRAARAAAVAGEYDDPVVRDELDAAAEELQAAATG